MSKLTPDELIVCSQEEVEGAKGRSGEEALKRLKVLEWYASGWYQTIEPMSNGSASDGPGSSSIGAADWWPFRNQ